MATEQKLETERDYWKTIENLGGMVWFFNHELADGRIRNPKGKVSRGVINMQEELNGVVQEACDKFGIIPPEDTPRVELGQPLPPAPEGRIYYWDWYKNQKRGFYTDEYYKLICSACPMSRGLESYFDGGGDPCTKYMGRMYGQFTKNYECNMVGTRIGKWTRYDLEERIIQAGGLEALERFIVKETELKAV